MQCSEKTSEAGRSLVGVKAAGVGKNPQARVTDGFRLQPEKRVSSAETGAISADPEDGEHARFILPARPNQPLRAGDQLVVAQLGGSGSGAIHEVGDSTAVFE